ncbi:RNA-directed DNA polymerase from mobile element jockey [Trichonephila clavipes]|nr:RNA-directed DNA polymerase from mobile element jockey [Trichonephila clavipes]
MFESFMNSYIKQANSSKYCRKFFSAVFEQVLDSSSTAQSNEVDSQWLCQARGHGYTFLDIAKAFDKIWHDGLLIKLIRLDLPPPDQVQAFSPTVHSVRVDKTLFASTNQSGLPQGSLSSPLLFTLYVNDMPQTDLSHLAMFADDTAIITQNKRFSVVISNLQHYISLLELWLTDWKIKVNASKKVLASCFRVDPDYQSV